MNKVTRVGPLKIKGQSHPVDPVLISTTGIATTNDTYINSLNT